MPINAYLHPAADIDTGSRFQHGNFILKCTLWLSQTSDVIYDVFNLYESHWLVITQENPL